MCVRVCVCVCVFVNKMVDRPFAEIFGISRHGFRDVRMSLVVSHHENGRPRVTELVCVCECESVSESVSECVCVWGGHLTS